LFVNHFENIKISYLSNLITFCVSVQCSKQKYWLFVIVFREFNIATNIGKGNMTYLWDVF